MGQYSYYSPAADVDVDTDVEVKELSRLAMLEVDWKEALVEELEVGTEREDVVDELELVSTSINAAPNPAFEGDEAED